MRRDIQELIPETHRELIEATPRGFNRSAVIGALLLGAVGGALLTVILPAWIAAAAPALLLVVQRIWVWHSDRDFDKGMAELYAHDLDWNPEEDSRTLSSKENRPNKSE